MSFFASVNLTQQTVAPSVPWEFKPASEVGKQIRFDKESRQDWYRNIATRHNYYTAIESANPNQRASKENNPPRFLHGFAADYDLKLTDEQIATAINSMKIKPQFIERSLGGNCRLVWLFPKALPVDTYDFCVYILDKAVEWLRMELLPGLDRPAFTDPTRLLCNGCVWAATGLPGITETELQNFFVESGKDFRFQSEDGVVIPMEVLEKAIREKFPAFTWPGEFLPESQGPSFWIPESKSSMSAIVKPDGIFSFSAHATKPFYSWSDILGADFVKQFAAESIAKATSDIYWDEKKFWRKKKGVFIGMDREELTNFFRCECNLSSKPNKNGVSQIDSALNHIYSENFVANAAPYVFHAPGILTYQGKRRLNTYVHQLIPPAEGKQLWGPQGNFPFLSMLLDNLFTPASQLPHLLAWWKHFYTSGLHLTPMPGQVVFLMGGVGVGKTFLNRELIGKSVGGFVDAANHIIKGGEFNVHMYEVPHWCIDDDTVSDSPQAQSNIQVVLKKSVANHDFLVNKKFNNSGMTCWMGRIICTTNLDQVSSRLLGPLDNSSMDKICVMRCKRESSFKFPEREVMGKQSAQELPFFLRWLVDWEPPAEVERDNRFGYKSFHERSMLEQSTQSSRVAPFKEILIGVLDDYFKQEPQETEWRGTVTKLIQTIHMNPLNEAVVRTLRLEQINRYLEQVEKEGLLKCRTEAGKMNTRVWIFNRLDGDLPTMPIAPAPLSTTNNKPSQFQKNA